MSPAKCCHVLKHQKFVCLLLIVLLTVGRVENVPNVNCSCRCSWEPMSANDSTSQIIATDDQTTSLLRLKNVLSSERQSDCSLQLNQSDIARIIDGRFWLLPIQKQLPVTTEKPPTRSDQNMLAKLSTTTRRSRYVRRSSYNYGSEAIAASMVALHPEAVDTYIKLASNILSSFSTQPNPNVTQVIGGSGGPVPERVRLNATEQRRLTNVLMNLFEQQQNLLMPVHNGTSSRNRQKRQVPPPALCNLSQQTEACRLLELVKAGTLFLLPTIPESGISDQQNAESSAFSNALDMCAGRQAKTITQNAVCIDADVLNSIGTFSINYYGQTAVPLTVKSMVGGIFPILSAGGSPSILHRYGAAVDFACGMFEPDAVPEACLKNHTPNDRSVFAENYGCGSSSSYFDSVHCTLGSVDLRASAISTFDPYNNNKDAGN